MFKLSNLAKTCIATAILVNSAAFIHAMDMNSDSNANSYYSATKSDGNVVITSDSELLETIKSKLKSGVFSKGYEQVNVRVSDGNVTLSGTVKTQSDKDKIEKEVRDLDGVKKLDSQIKVQEPSGKTDTKFAQDKYATAADEQLNKKIRDNVSRGWLWDSYKDVILNTSNGVVTLEGKVGSQSDQDKLIKEIQKVEGVKSVKSDLLIEK